MCGRFTRRYSWREVRDFLDVRFHEQSPLQPSYNVAPTQVSPISRLDENGEREIVGARWGLIPSWASDAKIGNPMINARAETVAGKPAFRSAFARRRCLVPVSGFYEWQKIGVRKQPWYFRPARHALMCFAGLWECWNKGGEPIESFTIITTAANETVREIHDRMPAIVAPECFGSWLDPSAPADALAELLRPAPADMLTAHAVSERVNSPRVNDPSLIEPEQP